MRVIDFMGWRRIALAISVGFLLLSVASFFTRQLAWGLDFTGGTLVEVHFAETAELARVRAGLEQGGFPGAIVVAFGTDRDVLIRLPQGHTEMAGDAVLKLLRQDATGGVELRRTEFVGPQVGDELREQGGLAMLLALGLITLYIAFRFQLKFAVSAVIALVHDIVITLGFFSLTGLEFDLTVLAAILAVIGYSLNDTIVVYDRIRENFRKLRGLSPMEVVNRSITETLGRTLVTSLTTVLVLVSLAIFGGDMIFGFALALLVGVTVGTYSSIYMASNILLMLGVTKEDLMLPVRDGADQDEFTP
ncbi:protein translocase subunit SecF [Haliea salexigens]|uniref:protein translocase subunit SecF n=1 Tax=Haliea salexigens TaxID=287487 RepID=UPI0003FC156A|nr:protein translocase subunit SecF [Haliea salexigens]